VTDNRSTYAIELEKRMRQAERAAHRAERKSKTYAAADLVDLYEVDPLTGCWMWTGEFKQYTKDSREQPVITGFGVHAMCGVAHNAMSRPIFEEQLGRILASDENVAGTCQSNAGDRHACVNPAHHVIRHGAGIFFDREMLG
jgi:hypothetical protein